MRRPRLLRRSSAAPPSAAELYREQRAQPIDPDLAVFAAYWNRGYACNPAAIHRKALELVPGLRALWVVKRDAAAALPPGVDHVHPGTPEYFDAMARGRWFVNNVNWPNNVVKREGQTHVMTHHGTPLKKMGLDLRDVPGREKADDFDKFMARCARWDYSIAANPFSTRVWAGAYPGLSFASLETGYPRNDVLAAATAAAVAAARAAVGLEEGDVAVLYAPTHREYETDGSELVDLDAFAGRLGPEHVLLARQHYLEDGGLRAGGGRVRDVSGHPSVEELCLAADVLVTDYSSIMFDYAVLDRPIVIHAPDWDTYRAKRGTYFDLLAEPPGVVTRSAEELAEALRSGRDEPALRAAFRERFCSLEDGGAAERVVRAVGAVKRLILVVGVGRSGTSLFAGIMGQLGFRIPQPEVVADETNPKGFGEPQWVVDFHKRIMRRKRVTVFDARPAAWEQTAAASAEPEVQAQLRAWLKSELDAADGAVVVKDPRVGWFLPLWDAAARDVGAPPAFVTMLRHPAQILTSAKRSYGTWQTDASRAAAWLNVMLETERATRGTQRAFVAYPDLLADWARELRRAGELLGLEELARLDRAAHPEVDAFVDPSLFRNRTGWEGLEVPERVVALAEEVWGLLQDADANAPALDDARERYRELYGEAEAIAHSSVIAVRPRKKKAAPPSLRARVMRRLRG